MSVYQIKATSLKSARKKIRCNEIFTYNSCGRECLEIFFYETHVRYDHFFFCPKSHLFMHSHICVKVFWNMHDVRGRAPLNTSGNQPRKSAFQISNRRREKPSTSARRYVYGLIQSTKKRLSLASFCHRFRLSALCKKLLAPHTT